MAGFVSEERLTYGPWPAIERMLARLIEHSGFKDVTLVGGSGDRGADVVGTFKGKRWVLQSKYRNSGQVDDAGAVEAVRALAAYDGDVAVAATNQAFSQSAHKFASQLNNDGVDLRLWNGAYLLKYYRSLPDTSLALRTLKAYQSDAVDSVEQARSGGAARALVVMATGLGKSIVASQVVMHELRRNPLQEVLVLAHTKDLIRQLEQSFWSQLDKNISTHLWTDGEMPAYAGGVVFATWQSVSAAIERETIAGRFGLVVVDEAHHAPSAAFRRMLAQLNARFLLGLTATPWRGDEASLADLFGRPVFTRDIVDGMQRGFLAEVDYRMLTDGIDWDEIALMSRQGYTVRDLNEQLIMTDRDVALVSKFAEHFRTLERPRALAFCRSIAHADRIQPLLASEGIRAALMHSKLTREERFRNLSSFRLGNLDCLISVEMLNEGIDVPDVNIVAFMRVTHSRRIFVQQLGRGLRIAPGKRKVLVLDFVADIRRIAACMRINKTAAARGDNPEVIRFSDGRIVKFDNDKPASFFNEYLADVADLEDIDDGARLRFPDSDFELGNEVL